MSKDKKTTTVTGRHVMVAVGLRPTYPDIPGAKEYCITRCVLSCSHQYYSWLASLLVSWCVQRRPLLAAVLPGAHAGGGRVVRGARVRGLHEGRGRRRDGRRALHLPARLRSADGRTGGREPCRPRRSRSTTLHSHKGDYLYSCTFSPQCLKCTSNISGH